MSKKKYVYLFSEGNAQMPAWVCLFLRDLP